MPDFSQELRRHARKTFDQTGRSPSAFGADRSWTGTLETVLWSATGVVLGVGVSQVAGLAVTGLQATPASGAGGLLQLEMLTFAGLGVLLGSAALRRWRERRRRAPRALGATAWPAAHVSAASPTTTPAPSPTVVNGHQDRRYKLISVLGRGGFGTVYRAQLLMGDGFTKPVALKVLRGDCEPIRDLTRRLRDEAKMLALVQHRSIVRVDELVKLNGRQTIVMECVDGRDLNAILQQGPVPFGPALEIAAEVASALHAAYWTCPPEGRPLRLVHRDIKPENVCVTPLGEVKVLDFGIATADWKAREASTQGQTFGTPDYMAPERFHLGGGPEADIYALGATLYELLAGLQFGRTPKDRAEHASAVDERLWRLWRMLSEEQQPVVAILREMLQYSAGDRPLARDVERRLLALARRNAGPTLHDWAEELIPTLAPRATELPPELDSHATYLVPELATPRLVGTDEVSASNWPAPRGEPRPTTDG